MGRKAALEMLDKGQIPERYQRNIGTIGIEGQKCLLNAKAVIVGAGGLGGNIIELLARQGVGYLRVVDGDSFAAQNLNRQLLANEHNLGTNKANAAASRIADINSDVCVEAVPQMLSTENARELLAGMDVVVDALDNVAGRLLLIKVAQQLGIPLIHGAIAGFAGQVTTVLPSNQGLGKIYEKASESENSIERMLGNPATTPTLTAAIQAQEVVKILTGVGELLSGRLLHFNTKLNLYRIFEIG